MTKNDPIVTSQFQPGSEPLNNLPLPVFEEFIGRQQEKAQLYELLHPQSPISVIALRGIGGTGKSSLAVEVGNSYAQRMHLQSNDPGFEVIVWVSVGTSQVASFAQAAVVREFRTLRDLLAAIALTFHRNDILRLDLLKQREAIRELLSTHRTLLIVDNLEESVDINILEFIENLPKLTKVLVTTRQMLVHGKDFPLEGLSISDADDFATSECDRLGLSLSHPQIQKLVYATSRIPLAIQFALGQMLDGVAYDDVLTQLDETGTEIAEDLLGKILERLEGKAAYTILLATSLFSQDVSRKTIGIAADFENQAECDEALQRLVTLSLLREKDGCFSMLPLVRKWLQRLLKTQPELEEQCWRCLTDEFMTYASPPRSESELQAEVEAAIDVAVQHFNKENWEVANQILKPFSVIPSAHPYIEFAQQMEFVERTKEQMIVAVATPEEMPRVCQLEGGEFVEGVASSSEKMMGIYVRNQKTFVVLKKRVSGEICGFASVWPVVSEFVDDILSQKRNYTQIRTEEVRFDDYAKSQPTDYYVDTVMVTDRNNIAGAYLLIRWVQKLLFNPRRIITVSVTPFGRHLVEKLGMRVEWQSEKPIGEDIHYCCIVDIHDPDQKSVADRIVSRRWGG